MNVGPGKIEALPLFPVEIEFVFDKNGPAVEIYLFGGFGAD